MCQRVCINVHNVWEEMRRGEMGVFIASPLNPICKPNKLPQIDQSNLWSMVCQEPDRLAEN